METSGPTPNPTSLTSTERSALLAVRQVAAHHVYDAECALHTALQAARGATSSEEVGQCDRWIAAAYAHLHAANLEYAAATAAVADRPAAGLEPAVADRPARRRHATGNTTDGGT